MLSSRTRKFLQFTVYRGHIFHPDKYGPQFLLPVQTHSTHPGQEHPTGHNPTPATHIVRMFQVSHKLPHPACSFMILVQHCPSHSFIQTALHVCMYVHVHVLVVCVCLTVIPGLAAPLGSSVHGSMARILEVGCHLFQDLPNSRMETQVSCIARQDFLTLPLGDVIYTPKFPFLKKMYKIFLFGCAQVLTAWSSSGCGGSNSLTAGWNLAPHTETMGS